MVILTGIFPPLTFRPGRGLLKCYRVLYNQGSLLKAVILINHSRQSEDPLTRKSRDMLFIELCIYHALLPQKSNSFKNFQWRCKAEA
jgi:hypothetical protein